MRSRRELGRGLNGSESGLEVEIVPTYPEASAMLKKWLSGYSNGVFGSWGDYDPANLRSAYRVRYRPDVRYFRFGFRIARTLLPPNP